ncbi:hypothetical protein CC78DRAFT_588132 [Lojkania enalia]|uniref:Cupredoxin n=1 Tax=Lojkania enalia TaxID=147567 RepID=A0A9P4JZ84_9PLEO|nr:hypothetical protein CC78DRAFT_588132 [Didymosphaeria enalia]
MFSVQSLATSLPTPQPILGPAGWNITTTQSSIYPTNTATSRKIVDILVDTTGLLTFNPDSVSVVNGTVLRFNFPEANYTLRTSASHPCSNRHRAGIDYQSFMPLQASDKFLVDFSVDSQDPRWFYCAEAFLDPSPDLRCHSSMVFSLNPSDLQGFSANSSRPTTHLLTTPGPVLNFCPHGSSGPSYIPVQPKNYTTTSTAPPNATAIAPEISNEGRGVFGKWYGGYLGSFFLALAI